MIDIRNIRYYELKIPFTRTFSHSSASRKETETVIVEMMDETGETGYGEGCPRSYVTGESIETVFQFIQVHEANLQEIKNFDELEAYVIDNKNEIDQNPAAWCALELAMLDLLAKTEKISVEALLGRNQQQSEYVYSAILGDSDPDTFHQLFQQYRQLGFSDFKIKLSGDIDKERRKLTCLNQHNREIKVRADANNLWDSPDTAIDCLNELSFDFDAIEEPVQSKQISDLQEVVGKTGMKIILDESLLRLEQVESLNRNPAHWIVNARVSKYGGILRSLKMIDELVKNDIDIIVGAHVGETSLLTRASLILADSAKHKLRAQEGGFSTHLITQDPFEPNLKIGKYGMIDRDLLDYRNKPGFGIHKV